MFEEQLDANEILKQESGLEGCAGDEDYYPLETLKGSILDYYESAASKAPEGKKDPVEESKEEPSKAKKAQEAQAEVKPLAAKEEQK